MYSAGMWAQAVGYKYLVANVQNATNKDKDEDEPMIKITLTGRPGKRVVSGSKLNGLKMLDPNPTRLINGSEISTLTQPV